MTYLSGKGKLAGERDSTKVTAAKMSIQRSSSPWYRTDWFLGLLLLLLVLLAYTPIWQAGFIWDDDIMLTANPCIVGPLGLKEIWTTNAADICPFVQTTLWFEHLLFGLGPLPYHLVSLFMHAGCAILLWWVLLGLRIPRAGAWLGAAIWALHPVQVESVAWISEMKNTESGIFFLLSVLFFVKYLTGGTARVARIAYGLSLLFALLAMVSKTSAVVLPFVLCLCALWIESQWRWKNLIRVAPILAMSIAACVLSIWMQTLQPAILVDPQWIRPLPERLATAGDAIWFYLGKLIWPDPLLAIYPRWRVEPGNWGSYVPTALVLLTLAILWSVRKRWARPPFFAFAYFVAALLPVLGLIDSFISRYSLVFDHFQYLASIGPLAFAGAVLVKFSRVISFGRPWLSGCIGAVLLSLLTSVSWQRVWAYQSEETLWTDEIAKNPDCWLGQYNVGNALVRRGLEDQAIVHYRKALEINANYDKAHSNLGNSLFKKGRFDEAIAEYRRCLKINSQLGVVHANLANALMMKGETSEAIEEYQIAVKLDPAYAQAHENLGVALLRKGQVDDAIVQYQKALEIDSNNPLAHANLGIALLQKGELGEAIAELERTLQLNPNLVSVRVALDNARALLRDRSAHQ